MIFPFPEAKERLIRIMGTFDLATGHADTWDELLDSLESELRDVLGHYREALAQQQQPVAYLVLFEGAGKLLEFTKGNYLHGAKVKHIPLYTTPPQRKWVGLTDEDCKGMSAGDKVVAMWADRTLKEKNNGVT
jgi:hypothetical protein